MVLGPADGKRTAILEYKHDGLAGSDNSFEQLLLRQPLAALEHLLTGHGDDVDVDGGHRQLSLLGATLGSSLPHVTSSDRVTRLTP